MMKVSGGQNKKTTTKWTSQKGWPNCSCKLLLTATLENPRFMGCVSQHIFELLRCMENVKCKIISSRQSKLFNSPRLCALWVFEWNIWKSIRINIHQMNWGQFGDEFGSVSRTISTLNRPFPYIAPNQISVSAWCSPSPRLWSLFWRSLSQVIKYIEVLVSDCPVSLLGVKMSVFSWSAKSSTMSNYLSFCQVSLWSARRPNSGLMGL